MATPRTWDVTALAGLFLTSGTLHLVRPQIFEPLMPALVPAHRRVIIGSGVLELGCAAGLLVPALRGPAGWLSAAVLVGVWPANAKMAIDALGGRSPVRTVLALGRLPLQVPLIRTALRAARG